MSDNGDDAESAQDDADATCDEDGCDRRAPSGSVCLIHAAERLGDNLSDYSPTVTMDTGPPDPASEYDTDVLPGCAGHGSFEYDCAVCAGNALAMVDAKGLHGPPFSAPTVVAALPQKYRRGLPLDDLAYKSHTSTHDPDGHLQIEAAFAMPLPTGTGTFEITWHGRSVETEATMHADARPGPLTRGRFPSASDPEHGGPVHSAGRAEPARMAGELSFSTTDDDTMTDDDDDSTADLTQWADVDEDDPLFERRNPYRHPESGTIIGFVGYDKAREIKAYATSPLRDYHHCEASGTYFEYPAERTKIECDGFVIPLEVIEELAELEVSRIYVHDARGEEYPAPDGDVIEYPLRTYANGYAPPGSWREERPGDDGAYDLRAPATDAARIRTHAALGEDLYVRSFEGALDHIREKWPGRLRKDPRHR